jgi:hypothetical protein
MDAARPPSLVLHSENMNPLAVRAQLDNLIALLNEKQDDVSARLILAGQAKNIAEHKTMLQEALNDALAIEKDEYATLESVNTGLKILENNAMPHLSAIEQTYSQLSPAPEADAVRAQALSDMTNLGNDVKTLQTQIEDRYSSMRTFKQNGDALEKLLLEQELLTSDNLQKRPNLENALSAHEAMQPISIQLEIDATELQPMRLPTERAVDFRTRLAILQKKIEVSIKIFLRIVCILNVLFKIVFTECKTNCRIRRNVASRRTRCRRFTSQD